MAQSRMSNGPRAGSRAAAAETIETDCGHPLIPNAAREDGLVFA
jgi:hypothetical protein